MGGCSKICSTSGFGTLLVERDIHALDALLKWASRGDGIAVCGNLPES
jgi:hypothetical protein